MFKTIKSLWRLVTAYEPGTGGLFDHRSEKEQERDYMFEETVSAPAPVKWEEKPRETWREFPEQDQHRTYSCVAQTLKKLLGVNYFLKTGEYIQFSATHIYQRRYNKPYGGMSGSDALEIVRKGGATLEELVPSNHEDDTKMDAVKIHEYKKDVGKVFRASNYLTVGTGNIEKIASIIQTTNKAVMVWFYFSKEEWSRFEPVILDSSLPARGRFTLRHSVAAVDFTMWGGQKALVIEDSSHFGGLSRRVITEDFFNRRNLFSAYVLGFRFDDQITAPADGKKPKHRFETNLSYTKEVIYSPEVTELQDALKHEGVFPNNVRSTGYYGAITSKAVLEFQLKHNVSDEERLRELEGKYVGPKTRAKLNELYG